MKSHFTPRLRHKLTDTTSATVPLISGSLSPSSFITDGTSSLAVDSMSTRDNSTSATTVNRHRQRRKIHSDGTICPSSISLPLFQRKTIPTESVLKEMDSKVRRYRNSMFDIFCSRVFRLLLGATTFVTICGRFFSLLTKGSLLEFLASSPKLNQSLHNRIQLNEYRGRERPRRSIEYVNLIDPQFPKSSLSNSYIYDVVIVGCGPAGLTAALFASRIGMSVLVLGSPSRGSLAGTDRLDNFPSYFFLGGSAFNGGGQGWIDATMDQAASFGAKFAPPTWLATGLVKALPQTNMNDVGDDLLPYVLEVNLTLNDPTNTTETGTIQSKVRSRTVIVASGSLPRKLNLPHESMLWGHSLHNCALCDGDAYAPKSYDSRTDDYSNNQQQTLVETSSQSIPNLKRGKSVAVIGGGDAAVEAVSLLARLGVETIHWIHRRNHYRASPLEVERVRHLPNVQVWTPFVVVEWVVKEVPVVGTRSSEGNSAALILNGVRVVASKNGVADLEASSSLTIPINGAFLMIGSSPNTKWLEQSGMEMDPVTGLIRLDPHQAISKGDSSSEGLKFPTSTSIPGVFAAGEAVDGFYRQALTAAAEGSKAAMDSYRWMRNSGVSIEQRPEPRGSSKQNNFVLNWHLDDAQSKEERAAVVDCDLTTSDCIKRLVSMHPVVVFSKPFCPYCRRALEALNSLMGSKNEPLVVDLTDTREGGKIQDALASMTGRRTVPRVFIGGNCVGGGDETTALFRSGELKVLLIEANAIP